MSRTLKWLAFVIGFSMILALVHPIAVLADDDDDDDGEDFVTLRLNDDDEWDDDEWDDDEWDDDDDDDDEWDDDDDDWDDDDKDDDDKTTFDVALPDQAIIHLHSGTDAAEFADDHDSLILSQVPGSGLLLLQLDPDLDDQDEVDDLLMDERVEWSELNYTSHAPEGRPRYFFTSTADQSGFVDTPALPLGLDFTAETACVDGSGVIVAVLDTGVDASHPQLADNIVAGGWNTLDDTDDIQDVGNGIDDDGDGQIDELVGHGTHVAGSIVQIAPEAQILPIKVLDSDGVGTTFSVTAGIYRSVDQGADVINLSLGSTHDSLAIRNAIEFAHANDVIVVAAAGNQNVYTPVEYPAAVDAVVSVAAVDASGNKATYSNFHETVDISAPGDNVASAFPEGQFLTASGTSMATPLVTGTIALLLDRFPGAVPDEIEVQLHGSVSPLNLTDPLLEGLMGSGQLDVDAAIACDEASHILIVKAISLRAVVPQ